MNEILKRFIDSKEDEYDLNEIRRLVSDILSEMEILKSANQAWNKAYQELKAKHQELKLIEKIHQRTNGELREEIKIYEKQLELVKNPSLATIPKLRVKERIREINERIKKSTKSNKPEEVKLYIKQKELLKSILRGEESHLRICLSCKQEFLAERSHAKYCSPCRRKINNSNWYRQISEEKREERRLQARNYYYQSKKSMTQGDCNETKI